MQVLSYWVQTQYPSYTSKRGVNIGSSMPRHHGGSPCHITHPGPQDN